MRSCTEMLDGGFTATGYQSCDARGHWSACIPIGACASDGGTALPAYARCGGDDQCGPSDCAVCTHYAGVSNPHGYSLCEVFCEHDGDCDPQGPTSAVTPTCILGQCALLCHAASVCPFDTECLPWADPGTAAMYSAYDGLCE